MNARAISRRLAVLIAFLAVPAAGQVAAPESAPPAPPADTKTEPPPPAPAPAAAPSASSTASPPPGTTGTGTLQKVELDLTVPDVPAFTALNVSPSKISTPTNIKDLVAALATGINASGQIQNGLALEISPFKLIENAVTKNFNPQNTPIWQKYLGGLSLSAATNSVTSGSTTTSAMQLATGARYALEAYTPTADEDLAKCINYSIPAPDTSATVLDADGNPLKPIVSTDTAAFKTARQNCRDAFKASHLASSGIQVAAVYSAQTTGSTELSNFQTLATSTWISASLGFNAYKVPIPKDPQDWTKTAASLEKNNGLGFQPTVMVRYDLTRISGTTTSQGDVFVGGRLPLISMGWSAFVEGGYKKLDVNSVSVPPATSDKQVPVGIGADVRLSNGTWLGVYAGADALSGALLSLGNIKWSFGEDRPYQY
jgi:hypothetical protein